MLEDIYINIDMDEIPKFAKLAGVSFNGRQDYVKSLIVETKMYLKRDYKNQYDKNAIGVYNKDILVGWIPKHLALKLAPEMDAGIEWHAIVKDVTGKDKDTKGVNIELICTTE